VAWVRDAATGSLQPFWLGRRLESIVSGLRSGEFVADAVAADAIWLLAGAEILTTQEELRRGRAERPEVARTRKGAEQFREKGYAPIRNVIHPFHIAALRRYYRHAIRRGEIRLGDNQSSRRYVAHNDSNPPMFIWPHI
jgi:hypothetical protein